METPALIDQSSRAAVALMHLLQAVKLAIIKESLSDDVSHPRSLFSLISEYYLSTFVIDVLDKCPVAH